MNCQEFSDFLDARKVDSHDMPTREAFDAHAARCSDCADALNAANALLAEKPPQHWRDLPADFVPLVFARLQPPRARRSRLRMLGWALAGAGTLSFASFGLWQALDAPESAQTNTVAPAEPADLHYERETPPPAAEARARDIVVAAETQAYAALGGGRVAADRGPLAVLADGEYFALLRFPPEFPAAARAQGLEGSTVVEFTITENGDVADPHIVESTDSIFDASSLASVRATKYKPRFVDGRAVAVPGIRNKVVFALAMPEPSGTDGGPDESEPAEAAEPEGSLPSAEFWDRLAPVVACIDHGDLACTEVKLDEFTATHVLSGDQRAFVQRIYGYVHLRRGDYERALEAYQRVLESASPTDWLYDSAGTFMTIARIYYERRDYQAALDYAVEYLKRTQRPTLADYVFVDRLRELGAVVR